MVGAEAGLADFDWFACGAWLGRPGGDLLSRALRRSTMGAGGFHGRVRDGIGCAPPAMATRPSKPRRPGAAVAQVLAGATASSSPRRDDVVVACVCWDWPRPMGVGMISMHGAGPALRPGPGWIEPIGRLGPVSSERCRSCTSGLSTWWSTTALGETWF